MRGALCDQPLIIDDHEVVASGEELMLHKLGKDWGKGCRDFGWFSRQCLQPRSVSVLELSLSYDQRIQYEDTKVALLLTLHGAKIPDRFSDGSNVCGLLLLHPNYNKELLKLFVAAKKR